MATETIQVAAVTSPDQWTLGAGADKVMAVNSPSDDNASYIVGTSTLIGQQYSLSPNTIPPGSSINSVSALARCRRVTNSAGYRITFALGGSTTLGPNHLCASTYTDVTDALTRPGGGNWTPVDLSTLEVQIYRVGGVGVSVHCTSLWVIVDYTPPPSAMFLLFP